MQWKDLWWIGVEHAPSFARWQASWRTPGELLDAVRRNPETEPRLVAHLGHREPLRVAIDRREAVTASLRERGFIEVDARPREELDAPLTGAISSPWIAVAGPLRPAAGQGIAVVGSRRITERHRAIAEELIDGIVASSSLPLISGGAYGVDAVAHDVALRRGHAIGLWVAGGLVRCGPSPHRDAFRRIAQAHGYVASERPPMVEAQRYEFVRRNRAIAAAAQVVVVFQAGASSGALVTAREAFRLGIPVLALPGGLDDPLAAGSNEILRSGGRPLLEPADVLAAVASRGSAAEDDRVHVPHRSASTYRAGPGARTGGAAQAGEPRGSTLDALAPSLAGAVGPAGLRVWEALAGDVQQTTDELVRVSSASAADVGTALFQLELAGCVRWTDGAWRRA